MEVKGALEEMLQASFGRKKGALQTQKKKKKSNTNSSCDQTLRSAKCYALCCKFYTGHFSCNC